MIQSLRDALNVEGWQPIATAPKDGTPVLLYENGSVGLFYWGVDPSLTHNVKGQPMPPTWVGVIIQSELNRSEIDAKIIVLHGSDATHWMPLPAGPKVGPAGGP